MAGGYGREDLDDEMEEIRRQKEKEARERLERMRKEREEDTGLDRGFPAATPSD